MSGASRYADVELGISVVPRETFFPLYPPPVKLVLAIGGRPLRSFRTR